MGQETTETSENTGNTATDDWRLALGGLLVSARELGDRVRDLVNQHLRQRRLVANTTAWYRLCVSMDNIGNTLTAIEGFGKTPYPSDQGARYVLLLGLMNAMAVQRDSVQAIARICAKDNAPMPSALQRLQETRNDLVHSFREKGQGKKRKPLAAVFISAMRVEQDSFHLYRANFGNDGRVSHREFPAFRTLPLVRTQLEWTCMCLENAVCVMEREDRQHKAKFGGRLLRSVVTEDQARYLLSKISAAVEGRDEEYGRDCLAEMRKAVGRIREDLEERGEIPASEWAQALVERIEDPLRRVGDFLNRSRDRPLREKETEDTKVMCEHVLWYLDAFFEGLGTIDEKYALT